MGTPPPSSGFFGEARKNGRNARRGLPARGAPYRASGAGACRATRVRVPYISG